MANKISKVVVSLTTVAGGLLLFGAGSQAQASSQYSASRSKAVKLIWRKSMGRHAYTATKGARYSKHLGTRYGYNSSLPNVTWVTDAHEKLYNKRTGRYNIYYHVMSTVGNHGGWIWRGYLKPKETQLISTALHPISTTNTPIETTDWNIWQNVGIRSSDKLLMELFPKTIFNNKLFGVAQDFLTEDLSADHSTANREYFSEALQSSNSLFTPKVKYSSSFVHIEFNVKEFNVQEPTNTKLMNRELSKAGYNAKTRAKYKGWYIGAYILGPDDVYEGVNPGDAVVLLMPQL